MKRQYRLCVADIDRTLRMKGEGLPELNRKAFIAMHEAGILLGLASGRPLWEHVETLYLDWDLGFQFDLLIGLNGGEIYDVRKNERTAINMLDPESIKYIIENLKQHNNDPFIYRNGYVLARNLNGRIVKSINRNNYEVRIAKSLYEFWAEPTAKVLYGADSQEELKPIEATGKSLENETICCFKTDVDLLEFQDRHNSKGEALKRYCKSNDIDLKDVIAFGDAENDIEMLKIAGYSVCLKNGMDDVKAICDDVTDYDAKDSGFGHYIFDHIL